MSLEGYDVKLDRLDVAVRAVVRVALRGRKELREELGIGEELREVIGRCVLQIERKPEKWREEDVFDFLQLVPDVLVLAIDLQVRYQARFSASRSYHYERRGA